MKAGQIKILQHTDGCRVIIIYYSWGVSHLFQGSKGISDHDITPEDLPFNKFNVGGYIKDIKRDLGYKEVKAEVEI